MLVGVIGEGEEEEAEAEGEEERNDSGDGDGDGDGDGKEEEEEETDCCRLSGWESKLGLERLIFPFLMAWGDTMEE